MFEITLPDAAATPAVFFRLLAVYGICLASGFALKKIASGKSASVGEYGNEYGGEYGSVSGNDSDGKKEANPSKGPGIGGKFRVFFTFQALILSLSFWWLPGLGLFFLVLFSASVFEVTMLLKKEKQHPAAGFPKEPAWGLVVLLGLSFLSFFALAISVSETGILGLRHGFPLLAFFFLLVAVFDGYSQIWGEVLGGRKMVPAISPGKTWSGFTGGLLTCMGVAVVGGIFIHPWLSLPWAVVVGAGIGLLAFLGDITASWVKRRLGVKDFSNLLGAQGGVLDRVDSLLWLGPALYILELFTMFLSGSGSISILTSLPPRH